MRAAALCAVVMLTTATTAYPQAACPARAAAAEPAQPVEIVAPSAVSCPDIAATYQDQFCQAIREIRKGLQRRSLGNQLEIQRLVRIQGANLGAFLLFTQARTQALDIRTIEDARTDKQVGSPANANGGGSAVSKGAVPSILGFAVENGALTQETSDTTVTLRGNAVGWLDLVQNQGFIAAYQDDSAIVKQLRRLSYSITLNTGAPESPRTAEEPAGGFTPAAIQEQIRAARQQVAGYSVRAALLDRRDPRTSENRSAVGTLVTAMRAAQAGHFFLNDVFNSLEYNCNWLPETAALLNNPTLNEKGLARVLYGRLEVLRLHMLAHIDSFDARVTRALLALQGFDDARIKVFQAMQKRPLIALEYVTARTKSAPDKSTVRLITEGQWGPRIDLTANVGWTFQHGGEAPSSEAAGASGMRDFQAAAQIDVPLKNLSKSLASAGGVGTPVFAVAYLSQKLSDQASVVFAGNTFTAEPGWIHLVQARLTLPIKGTGVKVPLSISFANRTELLKEKTIRGQIGLTLDLDVLSSLRR
jgi:hypothetical protein